MAVVKRKKLKVVKKKKVDTLSTNSTEMQNDQLELFRIKQQLKMLQGREGELKDKLKDYMGKVFKPDKNGHYLFTTIDENGKKIHLQKQARKKVTLNEERTMEYLAKKPKLKKQILVTKEVIAEEVTQDQILDVLAEHAPYLLDKKQVIDESAIEQLVLSEEMPMEDFEGLCDVAINYAMTYIDDEKLQQENDKE